MFITVNIFNIQTLHCNASDKIFKIQLLHINGVNQTNKFGNIKHKNSVQDKNNYSFQLQTNGHFNKIPFVR